MQRVAQEHEQRALRHGNQRSAEQFSQHHRPARNRRHQHRLQKSLAAVFDHRDRGEDGREQQNQHQRAGKKILEKRQPAGRARTQLKRRARIRRRTAARKSAAARSPRTRDSAAARIAPTRGGKASRPLARGTARRSTRLRFEPLQPVRPMFQPTLTSSRSRSRSCQKRWPVRSMNTSSSVGLPSVIAWICPGNASTSRAIH